jgi:hypothetical protein
MQDMKIIPVLLVDRRAGHQGELEERMEPYLI